MANRLREKPNMELLNDVKEDLRTMEMYWKMVVDDRKERKKIVEL